MTIIEKIGMRWVPRRFRASVPGAAGLVGLLLMLCVGGLPTNAAGASASTNPSSAKVSEPSRRAAAPELRGAHARRQVPVDRVVFRQAADPAVLQSGRRAGSGVRAGAGAPRVGAEPLQLRDRRRRDGPRPGERARLRRQARARLPDFRRLRRVDRRAARSPVAAGIAGHRCRRSRRAWRWSRTKTSPPYRRLPSKPVFASTCAFPAPAPSTSGELDQRPKAPPFEAERMGGGDRFRLADLSGKPVVLVFFLPTCPHCQDALRFFKSELAAHSREDPSGVGGSVDRQPLLRGRADAEGREARLLPGLA